MVTRRKRVMDKDDETEQLVDKSISPTGCSRPTSYSCDGYLIPLSDAAQVIPPFLLAGFGTLAAGLLLAEVQNWVVFKEIPELFVLVPSLLGLKGNLAMTLASRLSTEAHRGFTSIPEVIKGYLSLDQAQALIVGVLASFIAVATGITEGAKLNYLVLVIATAVITASLVSILLGGLMCAIVIGSTNCHYNPDNIATPIAASTGDVITLSILSLTAHFLFHIPDKDTQLSLCVGIIIVFLLLILPLLVYSWRNRYARPAVLQGWAPILLAMLISSGVGIVMSEVAKKYPTVIGFLPIINGIGGNIAAIQASRLSTSYNITRSTDFGEVKMSVFLLALVLPGHSVFLFAKALIDDSSKMTVAFYAAYFTSAVIQVAILLALCYLLVMISPRLLNLDPDLYSIPILTAIGDFLGTSLLTLSTFIISNAGIF